MNKPGDRVWMPVTNHPQRVTVYYVGDYTICPTREACQRLCDVWNALGPTAYPFFPREVTLSARETGQQQEELL